MAANANLLTNSFQGLSRLPMARQVGLMLGFAASVTLAISIILWAREPNYALLYANLAERDTGEVAQSLAQAAIPHRLDPMTGGVVVPASRLYEARIHLAQQGLPRTAGFGFELLEQEQGLGTSRLVETARYHRALEGELARSISTLSGVEGARVHLAMPKQSVFVRDRTKPSASVLLNLFSGRTLDETRVAGIVHLVASSIPELEPDRVTVVDQRGNLLTASAGGFGTMAMSGQQLDHVRRIEEAHVRRILEIVSPIVGAQAVRAQVAADVDFSQIERTSESFDPEFAALRSEQMAEDISGSGGAGGIPGALTNQPPPAGAVGMNAQVPETRGSSSRRSTRNYELDRTVSHIREASAAVRKLSVAVVVDYREQISEEGAVERVPLTQEELDRITTLVRDAVGYDGGRGDSLNVINASFKPEVMQDVEVLEIPIWQQAWFYEALKYLGAGAALLVLFFGVLRPILKNLAGQGEASSRETRMALPPGGEAASGEATSEGQVPGMLEGPGSKKRRTHEEHLEAARQMVQEDPKLVAQVVKTWVTADGG